ncbi:ribosome silencing factor [Luteolibacter pohnpeiensis]|uniref:Ribosomal silencing factor RsfS n=1 Tax=Luteolibacter pohnpeiensis TaxID=454153 RepID=A0A934S977_9BACT|nr:ribosome silencing factor [Luteolibacter pohnpeiensis]MBK1883186.1 ribosome silencing factor [Luteolibacter pohnpeiensis]
MAINGEELALACAKAADDIQAENIRVWDMRGVSSITDYMVVCSGSSMPHLRAVLRDIAGQVEELYGNKPAFSEGKADTRWVVLDFVDVMVHVMHDELRDFYALEELWADAKEIDWKKALA